MHISQVGKCSHNHSSNFWYITGLRIIPCGTPACISLNWEYSSSYSTWSNLFFRYDLNRIQYTVGSCVPYDWLCRILVKRPRKNTAAQIFFSSKVLSITSQRRKTWSIVECIHTYIIGSYNPSVIVFASNLLRGNRRRNIFCFCFDVWSGTRTLALYLISQHTTY